MSSVEIERLDFAYQAESPIFREFSLDIGEGERWSIIGPSGCGKTTFLYLLAGLRRPSRGCIRRDNGHSNGHSPATGLVLQDFGLLPWATAAENIALGMKIQKVEKATARRITQSWLEELGLEDFSDHYPIELSGGQRQRVAIARTLALEPELLLMDEPFASLDTLTREDLLKLVLNLWKRLASTMMFVTHNIEEAVFWGSKIMVLGDPPNTHAALFENTLSGSSGYRDSPNFMTTCQELRHLIQENSRSPKAVNKV